jgi:hypothetical protein
VLKVEGAGFGLKVWRCGIEAALLRVQHGRGTRKRDMRGRAGVSIPTFQTKSYPTQDSGFRERAWLVRSRKISAGALAKWSTTSVRT